MGQRKWLSHATNYTTILAHVPSSAMCAGQGRRDAPPPEWSNQNRADWDLAGELLQTNQYERLAEFLQGIEATFASQTDPVSAQVLALAMRLCLACSQSQTEAAWHRQGQQKAAQREQHLRQQIYAVLDLLAEADPPYTPTNMWPSFSESAPVQVSPFGPRSPAPEARPSLWQRIRDVFRPPTALSLPNRPAPPPAQEPVPHYPGWLALPPSSIPEGTEARSAEPISGGAEVVSAFGAHQTTMPSGPRTEEADSLVPEAPTPSPFPGEQAAPETKEGAVAPALSGSEAPEAPAVETVPTETEAPKVLAAAEMPAAEKGTARKAAGVEAAEDSGIQREQPETPFQAPTPLTATLPVSPEAPSLVVYCLGPFQVYQGEQQVSDWPSSKGKSIFKYLVVHRKRPVPKEVLMELFWPGAFPDAARNNLNVAIYGLRQALRQARPSFSHVLFQDDCYLFNPDQQIWVDVEEFEARCKIARNLEEKGDLSAAMCEYRAAEALYQGEFLEEDRYEDWLIPLRQNLQTTFLSLLDRLSRYDLGQEDYASCATVCRRLLAVDPCHEAAHRRIMRCYSRQGQPYLALRQYHLCVKALSKELEVFPTAATAELYELIRRHQRI